MGSSSSKSYWSQSKVLSSCELSTFQPAFLARVSMSFRVKLPNLPVGIAAPSSSSAAAPLALAAGDDELCEELLQASRAATSSSEVPRFRMAPA